MDYILHHKNGNCAAEVHSDAVEIRNTQDALDMMANAGYLGATAMIIHENQLDPGFFNLRSGLAGEILQKFSNYRMKLAIVGNFTKYQSKSLHDFILESNKGGRIYFVTSVEIAKASLLR
jgi:hypothetical protein